MAARAYKVLKELDAGRIPWYRRVEFKLVESLGKFLSPVMAQDFDDSCGESSIILVNAADYPLGEELNALAALASFLKPGTVIALYSVDASRADFCTFGLFPLMRRPIQVLVMADVALFNSLLLFVVAPRLDQIARLDIAGLQNLRSAVGLGAIGREQMLSLASERLSQVLSKRPHVSSSEWLDVSHVALRDIFELARFKRLQRVFGGVIGHKNGTLQFVTLLLGVPPVISLKNVSILFLARLFGGASSPYACLEDNLYAHAPYAPKITKAEKSKGLFPLSTAVYGEVDPRGLHLLLSSLGGINHTDVFFDLGSGLGKAVLQVFYSTNASRVVGVELAKQRHEGAKAAVNDLDHRWPTLAACPCDRERTLDLLHEDVLQANLTGASVVWLGSLAFPSELMAKIAIRLRMQASLGCKVLTMIEFPVHALAGGDVRRVLSLRAHWPTRVRWSDKADAGKALFYEITEA